MPGVKVSPLIVWAVFAYTIAIVIAVACLLPASWPWSVL